MSAPNSTFDIVRAAEALLENAKKLQAGNGDDEQLRRAISMSAKKIASEAAPAIDLVKADWVMMADVAAWNLLLDWKAFDHIPLEGSIAISELATALNAQESLVGAIPLVLGLVVS